MTKTTELLIEIGKETGKLQVNIAKLRTDRAILLEALKRCNHTLTCHGHIDSESYLHLFIIEAIKKAEKS